MTTWGIAATIKAPVDETLHFAAYHLEAGAARLFLYLDDANEQAQARLRSNPRVVPVLYDDTWWKGRRPKKHQVRQTRNATHAYTQAGNLDWLIHMDVDEFLVADKPVTDLLATLPPSQTITRVRPMEQLAGDGGHFKAFIPPGPARRKIVKDLYPTYGRHLKDGFLSHVAGKVFVRTGLSDIQVRIHNVFQNDDQIKGPEETPGLLIAHRHAPSWDSWLASYRYRLERGAYRADLAANSVNGVSLHEVLAGIEAEEGEPGLRAFFEEVCADTPALRERLTAHGLLRHRKIGLNTTIEAHFPL